MMQGQAALSKDRIRKASPRKSRKPDRDAIVNDFLPSIRIHASRLKMRIPPHIETDDLVSSGVVGLLDALNRFDDFLQKPYERETLARKVRSVLDAEPSKF